MCDAALIRDRDFPIENDFPTRLGKRLEWRAEQGNRLVRSNLLRLCKLRLPRPSSTASSRFPSCLISCSHSQPGGGSGEEVTD